MNVNFDLTLAKYGKATTKNPQKYGAYFGKILACYLACPKGPFLAEIAILKAFRNSFIVSQLLLLDKYNLARFYGFSCIIKPQKIHRILQQALSLFYFTAILQAS